MNDEPIGEVEEQAVGEPVAPEHYGSVRERLRARREELRERDTLELAVPGYDGELAIRYKLMPQERSDEVSRQAAAAQRRNDNPKARQVMADFLIESCDCVLVQNGDGTEPLVDDHDDPVRFDQRLAKFLDFEADSAREVVVGTFSPFGQNPDAVSDHIEALGLWRRGRDEEIDQALLGG